MSESSSALTTRLDLTALVFLIVGLVTAPAFVLAQGGSIDGDKYAELAIGVPYENLDGEYDAGCVNVLRGSFVGLRGAGGTYLDRATPEPGDIFGFALAMADFNGDGFFDLAIGVPNAEWGTAVNAGMVRVNYGSAVGLTASGEQLWTQDLLDIASASENHDKFGQSLAAGDFNGDGFADLAIGVPEEDFGVEEDAGEVNVLYGTASGLSTVSNQSWSQATTGIDDDPEWRDSFGAALVTGDFNRDGFADLAIGAYGESHSGAEYGGAAHVIYGSEHGLDTAGTWMFHQEIAGLEGTSETQDFFGRSLAAGDFNRDGFTDLAVGVPGDNVYGDKAGAVNVLLGSSEGLIVAGDQIWHQDVGGTQCNAEGGDSFGRSLAAGDFDNDGYCDLAVGAPYKNQTAGAVHVFYGGLPGLTTIGDWCLSQDTADIISDSSEIDDYFGRALAAGDFNGDRFIDLAIGVPGEDLVDVSLADIEDAGLVHVLEGTSTGLTVENNTVWHQNMVNVFDTVEAGDNFGRALAAPTPPLPVVFLDGFEGGTTTRWSAAVP